MTVEKREHGLSSFKTWLLWFRQHAGGFPFLAVQVILMTIDRVFYIATEYWLTIWTKGSFESVDVFGHEFPAQTDGRLAQCK